MKRENKSHCVAPSISTPTLWRVIGTFEGGGGSQKSHFQGDGDWVRPKHFLHCGGMDQMETTHFYTYVEIALIALNADI